MKQTQQKRSRIMAGGEGVGAISAEIVERRAREIALIDGRSADGVMEEDRRKALAELHDEDLDLSSEESDVCKTATHNPADMAVDAGHPAAIRRPVDEQTLEEEEVAEGVEEAEHERMLESRRSEQDSGEGKEEGRS